MLLDTKQMAVAASADAALFAFKAPEGSRELSLEEMMSDKWYHDLDEAKEVASKTGRKIFVDFYATWCGPCKMLAAEVFPLPEFKKLSKSLVFCKIDVDAQKSVAQQYKITAMPTQMVLNADGSVVETKIGYGGVQDFFNFINGHAK
jgi:thioredoxin